MPMAVSVSGMNGAQAAVERLASWFRKAGPVVVALSGGVDSALLAVVASQELGEAALAVTGVSLSLPRDELDFVRQFVSRHGIAHLEIETGEFDDPAYLANSSDRCYFCKSHLFEAVLPVVSRLGATVVVGTNLDDLDDFRPGQRAAELYGVRSPYVECSIGKAEIRGAALLLGLAEIAGKPASACLSSRIPYGTPVSLRRLSAVEEFERYLRDIGFSQCRVRHHGEIARIEVVPEEFELAVAEKDSIAGEGRRLGFIYTTLDLGGLVRGSLNLMSGRRDGAVQSQALVRGRADPRADYRAPCQ